MRKIRKRRMAAVMVLCVGLLSGCAGKTQTDDLVITIPEYEKITYTTEPVVHGDIAPVLDLRLKSEQFERKNTILIMMRWRLIRYLSMLEMSCKMETHLSPSLRRI